jgi:serine/threonine protein kinase/Flp pilus assembly protein TadD
MQEQSLFIEALEREEPAERAAFLDRACAGDPALRQRIERLLQRHQQADCFLERPAVAPAPTGAYTQSGTEEPARGDQPENRAGPGTVIGPYKLLQQLGEGGMGTVFMAEQTEPVQRKVALKLIKLGLDSAQIVARFEAERQALALMDHPNIARVLEAGTTDSGRPYFVMELVKGVAITRYCDEQHLTPRQRLELFVPVCQAVQHAHQKGITHRDIKPSNVMVCLYDDKPVPKVIDFGIAKAAGPRLTEKTLFTEFGQVVGTLEYMSPEQAQLNQLDIDTRSDIYSLGVLLYELLTGTTPLERKRFKEVAFLEVLRLIREEETPRPSTRLSTSEGLPSIAANRGSEPKKLSGLMRGELDWIVMRALEKDRNRRYETANSFAEDVQRYLNDEAVQACPPSAWYRFRKFARRNKTRLAITGLILFFLVLLGGGGGWMMRDRAAREEEVVRDRAARQAVLEERVRQALNEAAERQAQGKWSQALAAASRAEELVASGGSDDLCWQARWLRADLEMVAAVADIRLQSTAVKDGHYDLALKDPAYAKLFREYGLDLARGVGGAEAAQRIRATSIGVELAAALDDWAMVCRTWQPQADTTWKELLAIARVADPDPFRNQLRDAWERRDGKALKDLAAAEKAADLPTATVLLLGDTLTNTGAIQAAVDLLRRAQRRQPADFWINHGLAYALTQMQPPQLDEAIGYYRAALALGPESPGVYVNLGNALRDKGRRDEALAAFQEAIRLNKDYAHAHYNLGLALHDKGRLDEALAEYQEAIRLNKDFVFAHLNLGNALRDKGRLDEAIAEYQEAIHLKKDYAVAHYNLGNALRAKGRLDEAIAAYQEAIRLKKDYAEAHNNLGNALMNKGRLDQAIAAYQEAIRLKKDLPQAHLNLGNALRDKGRLDEAIAEYQEAIRLKKDLPEAHCNLGTALDYALAHNNLGGALHAKGRLDEAIAAYQEAIRLNKDFALAHYNLGGALLEKGQFAQALASFRRGHELGSRKPRWPYPSAQWVRNAERLVALDDKLPTVLSGKVQPADTAERLALAQLCQAHKKRYAAAARFYAEVFAAEPKLNGDHPSGLRCNAACAAALAGCGQGEDTKSLDEKERARLRRQALDWLRADLAGWGRLLAKEPAKARPVVVQQMRHWLDDPDFAGVRGTEALERLPAAERPDWQKLWQDVEELRQRAAALAEPPRSGCP